MLDLRTPTSYSNRSYQMRYLAISIASFVFAGVGLLSAADDAKDEAIRKDLKSITGTWTVTSREADGEKSPADALKGVIVKVAADGIATVTKDGTVIRKVKWVNMDPTQKMKTVDVEVVEGDDKGKTLLAIYRVKGDQFTVCVAKSGKDRPTAFSTEADSGRSLMTYTRSKDE
jgi:uncharacterized protein (TIGR03067 family)